MKSMMFGVAAIAAGVCSTSASAQLWLSGAVQYLAGANGQSVSEPAEYDNIVGTNNSAFSINGAPRGTTHALTLGANTFTFTRPGGYNALSFYFGTTADPFSRPFASMPDLVVYGADSPLTPAVGAGVQTNGQFSGTLPWSGAGSFTSGDWTVTVTAFTANTTDGTFTLTVTQVPAPGAAALLGLGSLASMRRRR